MLHLCPTFARYVIFTRGCNVQAAVRNNASVCAAQSVRHVSDAVWLVRGTRRLSLARDTLARVFDSLTTTPYIERSALQTYICMHSCPSSVEKNSVYYSTYMPYSLRVVGKRLRVQGSIRVHCRVGCQAQTAPTRPRTPGYTQAHLVSRALPHVPRSTPPRNPRYGREFRARFCK